MDSVKKKKNRKCYSLYIHKHVAYVVPTYLVISFSLTSLIMYISFFNFIATQSIFNFWPALQSWRCRGRGREEKVVILKTFSLVTP